MYFAIHRYYKESIPSLVLISLACRIKVLKLLNPIEEFIYGIKCHLCRNHYDIIILFLLKYRNIN